MHIRFLRRVGRFIRAGDRAACNGDWPEAARNYAGVLRRRPGNAAIWVQYGHALKECGRDHEAVAAYAAAAGIEPGNHDAHCQHAISLFRIGQPDEAITVLLKILTQDPSQIRAFELLVEFGGRDRISEHVRAEVAQAIQRRIDEHLTEVARDRERLQEAVTMPITRHSMFRKSHPIEPPPSDPFFTMCIVIDARNIAAPYLQATLYSILTAGQLSLSVNVVGNSQLLNNPIASLADADPRVRFHTGFGQISESAPYRLYLSAGTILDAQAIAWFGFALHLTNGIAAFSDHDHGVEHWKEGYEYDLPVLWGRYDPIFMSQTREIPAAVVLSSYGDFMDDEADGYDGPELRRQLLLKNGLSGRIIHIPRLLATVLRIPERAAEAPQGSDPIALWSVDPAQKCEASRTPFREMVLLERPERPTAAAFRVRSSNERIEVIIQTRDAADLLAVAVKSLQGHLKEPERVFITIVDNRSQKEETKQFLSTLTDSPRVSVIRHDHPFNWSLANNIASARSQCEHLIFANNDVEMLTDGWDELALGYLQQEDVGIVGCRLLYPDRTIQHAGILLGLGDGAPLHEGAHIAEQYNGPLNRFDLTRLASAVTGAFMGITKRNFERLGGFDASALPVGYNDVDLCLRARERGLKILYAPTLELIHHESITRGRNVHRDQVAWDQNEKALMFKRWRAAFLNEPSYNPQWSRSRPFDGLREPSAGELIDYIAFNVGDPWRTAIS